MKPAPFAYHRAYSVGEAVALLAELGDEAKILAGGLSLVPMMNFRLARPAALIDVTRIEGLSYLRADPADGLRIGALTTHRTVETTRDPAVRRGFGVLPRSARWIGHYPIRSRGTFGGSIAHADPASEWCLLAVLLDAQVVLTGPQGRREVPAAEFFGGYYTTAASPEEMITEVRFPRPAPRAVLTEFAPRQGDFAVVAAAVSPTSATVPAGPPGWCWAASGRGPPRSTRTPWPASPPPRIPGRPWGSTPRARSTRRKTPTAAASTGGG